VKNFDRLAISFVDGQGNPIAYEVSSAVEERQSLSTTWKLCFDASYLNNDRNSFTLKIAQGTAGDTAKTSDGHSLFRKFFIHIDANRNAETDQIHPVFELADTQIYPNENSLLSTLNTIL